MIATLSHPAPSPSVEPAVADYVEIGLLLPTNPAAALVELARDRRESVGQILRKLVDRALTEDRLAG